MKDARGHGSNGRGGGGAAHQSAVNDYTPNSAGQALYQMLSAHAQRVNPDEHSGFSKQDLIGMSGYDTGGPSGEADWSERSPAYRRDVLGYRKAKDEL